jgi:hypothetical protein
MATPRGILKNLVGTVAVTVLLAVSITETELEFAFVT